MGSFCCYRGENDGKTEHRYFVIGVGCLAETAGERMLNTKRLWGERYEVLVATHLNTD